MSISFAGRLRRNYGEPVANGWNLGWDSNAAQYYYSAYGTASSVPTLGFMGRGGVGQLSGQGAQASLKYERRPYSSGFSGYDGWSKEPVKVMVGWTKHVGSEQ